MTGAVRLGCGGAGDGSVATFVDVRLQRTLWTVGLAPRLLGSSLGLEVSRLVCWSGRWLAVAGRSRPGAVVVSGGRRPGQVSGGAADRLSGVVDQLSSGVADQVVDGVVDQVSGTVGVPRAEPVVFPCGRYGRLDVC
ncbi:hypothetical protein [Amycolatopsis sp. WGS_07]|uniref:hypothetical protein n=1 Tax=Amycolatopsis sp. WGS_07 TaxID=3076764 RepID=UPI0038739A92